MGDSDEKKNRKMDVRARMKLARTATLNSLEIAKFKLVGQKPGQPYEPSTTGKITWEGFLYKKSPGGMPLMRHWHKRWFVLESPHKLLYYADKTKAELKGIIPLEMIEKMLSRSTRLAFLMEGVEGAPPRKFSLKGETEEDIKLWVTALEAAFAELDRLEDELEAGEDLKVESGDDKYWKVETRKKLNLSQSMDPKKKGKAKLKIDPRAKVIEEQLKNQAQEEKKDSAHPYMPLEDPPEAVSTSASPSSASSPSSSSGPVDASASSSSGSSSSSGGSSSSGYSEDTPNTPPGAERQRTLDQWQADAARLAEDQAKEAERLRIEAQERAAEQERLEAERAEVERRARMKAREDAEQAELAAAIAASEEEARQQEARRRAEEDARQQFLSAEIEAEG